jgi:hypothetical protein
MQLRRLDLAPGARRLTALPMPDDDRRKPA